MPWKLLPSAQYRLEPSNEGRPQPQPAHLHRRTAASATSGAAGDDMSAYETPLLDALAALDTALQAGANDAVRERLWGDVVRVYTRLQAGREYADDAPLWADPNFNPMGA